MTTINIPLQNFPVGVTQFPTSGGALLADNESSLNFSIDRTVASNGLNVSPGTSMALAVFVSTDGGTTFPLAGGCTFDGGPVGDTGNEATTGFIVNLPPGQGRLAFATVQATGGTLRVRGSVVTS